MIILLASRCSLFTAHRMLLGIIIIIESKTQFISSLFADKQDKPFGYYILPFVLLAIYWFDLFRTSSTGTICTKDVDVDGVSHFIAKHLRGQHTHQLRVLQESNLMQSLFWVRNISFFAFTFNGASASFSQHTNNIITIISICFLCPCMARDLNWGI